MKIIVNGKNAEFDGTSLLDLAKVLSLPDKGIAIAIDKQIVTRSDWEATTLSEGAEITIIKAACGG